MVRLYCRGATRWSLNRFPLYGTALSESAVPYNPYPMGIWVVWVYGYMGCGSGRFFLVRSSLDGGLRAALVTPYPALVTLYPFLVTPYTALVTPGPALVAPDSAVVTPDLALAAQGPAIVTPGLVAYPFEFPVGGVFPWLLLGCRSAVEMVCRYCHGRESLVQPVFDGWCY